MNQIYRLTFYFLITISSAACKPELLLDEEGKLLLSELQFQRSLMNCQGRVHWDWVPADKNIEAVYNHSLRKVEWRKSMSHENYTGVYNHSLGGVEWRLAHNEEKYIGVYNFAQGRVEWRLNSGDVKHFGVYNPVKGKVEWQKSSTLTYSGVFNYNTMTVEWAYMENGLGSVVGIYDLNKGAVDWRYTEPGFNLHVIYDHKRETPIWRKSSNPGYYWLQYDYNKGQLEQKYYFTSVGKYAGAYACDPDSGENSKE